MARGSSGVRFEQASGDSGVMFEDLCEFRDPEFCNVASTDMKGAQLGLDVSVMFLCPFFRQKMNQLRQRRAGAGAYPHVSHVY